MKIIGITTRTAQHLPGVGTLPITLTTGRGSKYPNMKLELVEPGVGVKVTINGLSAVIPWEEIKIAPCAE